LDVVCTSWSLALLVLTRLYNPHIDIWLIFAGTTSQWTTSVPEAIKQRLGDLKVHVICLNEVAGRGKILAVHHGKMFPAEQVEGRTLMFARFCYQADLANLLGHERILTVDSDIGIFEDFRYVTSYDVDIVTPADWTSQFVLWKRTALSDFCSAITEHFALDEKVFLQQQGLFPSWDVWNDMFFLRLYLGFLAPNASRHIFLPHFPSHTAPSSRFSLKWVAAANLNSIIENCEQMERRVCVETPFLQVVPHVFFCNSTVSVGALHFQGDRGCKAQATKFYNRDFYALLNVTVHFS
jgi:hypothetical protein